MYGQHPLIAHYSNWEPTWHQSFSFAVAAADLFTCLSAIVEDVDVGHVPISMVSSTKEENITFSIKHRDAKALAG